MCTGTLTEKKRVCEQPPEKRERVSTCPDALQVRGSVFCIIHMLGTLGVFFHMLGVRTRSGLSEWGGRHASLLPLDAVEML